MLIFLNFIFFKKNKRKGKKKSAQENSALKQFAQVTLGSANLRLAVKLPEGEDLNEWLAVNSSLSSFNLFSFSRKSQFFLFKKAVDFFNQINMLYGTITEFCTPSQCPVLSAGPKYEYHWADGNIRRAIRCSAPEYVDFLMAWVQNQLDDENIFPSKPGIIQKMN